MGQKLFVFFSCVGIALLCTACVSQQQRIEQAITEANYCETKADCAAIESQCPFGCYVFVNQTEADRIQTMVSDYPSNCVYGCIQLYGYDCLVGKCEAITTPPTAAVGGTCSTDADCLLPMEYAIQSNCPYAAFCDAGSCVVACPQAYYSPNPEESVSYFVSCEQDSDCVCDQVRSATSRCACLSGQCAAIVE